MNGAPFGFYKIIISNSKRDDCTNYQSNPVNSIYCTGNPIQHSFYILSLYNRLSMRTLSVSSVCSFSAHLICSPKLPFHKSKKFSCFLFVSIHINLSQNGILSSQSDPFLRNTQHFSVHLFFYNHPTFIYQPQF